MYVKYDVYTLHTIVGHSKLTVLTPLFSQFLKHPSLSTKTHVLFDRINLDLDRNNNYYNKTSGATLVGIGCIKDTDATEPQIMRYTSMQ